MTIPVTMRRLAVAGVAAALVAPVPVVRAAGHGGGADEIYVAPWGRDRWPGTLARPFATLARAQRAVRGRTARMDADIVVNLRAGTHRLTAPLRLAEAAGDSGRNGHRVIYQAYGYGTSHEEPVTVSGGRTISSWRPDPSLKDVWRADAGNLETRQLYVNDRRATRASLGVGLPGTVRTTKTGYITDSTVPQTWRNPADIEFVYTFPLWAEARCGVAGITGDARRSTITMDPACWKLARAEYEDDSEPISGPTGIENSASFLATPGSWYLDRSRPGHHVLLYRPRAGEDMRGARVIAPVLQTLVSGRGGAKRPLHDVAFRGLTFAHATWLAPNQPAGYVSSWSLYKRPGVKSWLTVPGNIAFSLADRISLEGNRFTHLGAQALEITRNTSDVTVRGNEFTDVSDGAILLGVPLPAASGTISDTHVTDNWIHRIGVEYRAASGIWNTAGKDTVLDHNQINDVPYNGILSGRDPDLPGLTRGARITGNRIFDTNRLLADGGGIYLRGRQGSSLADGALIAGNAVTDSPHNPFDIGIYTDDTIEWVTVRGNVIYRYRGSIGGCSETAQGRPVRNVRYQANFWDDTVPDDVKRRPYPGTWPSAADDCGDPENLTFTGNTRLSPGHPDQACLTIPACASIITISGPHQPFRNRLRLG
ncbi:right-handed parallel beta-helix repeat-containing protein [Actinomadura fibrosa]|uniref:Right-handed parallel beta-helix repeat-containing protein n=1 Tax=Actinomadura fibrosa TaxID=111802 RepID=A0ABW2XRQ7_9ACTN|nr:right-handed parallel beta-helix repeat-containing protein [Actinomadura fibrosa]